MGGKGSGRKPYPRKVHPYAYKLDRNIEIYERFQKGGVTYADLGRIYNLTRNRVRQIVATEGRRYYKRKVARIAREKFQELDNAR